MCEETFVVHQPSEKEYQVFIASVYGIGNTSLLPAMVFWRAVDASDTSAIKGILSVFHVKADEALDEAINRNEPSDVVEKLLVGSEMIESKFQRVTVHVFENAMEVRQDF
jgi:hypothetical protein